MEQAKKLTRGGVALFAVVALLIVGAASLTLAPQKAWASGIAQTAATDSSLTMSWEDPYANSAHYTTVRYKVSWGPEYNTTTGEAVLSANQTSLTISRLKPGTKYYAEVEYTYKSDLDGREYSSTMWSYSLATRVAAPTGIKQVKWWYWAKSVQFAWNVQNAADRVEYRVVRADKNKAIAGKTVNSPYEKFTVDRIDNSLIYTVQMRVHDKWGWSAWSKKAYLFTQPMVKEKKTKVSGKKLTVAWNKVKGATSYTVYASTKEKKGYKKIKTVKASKSSLTFKKIGKAKINPKKTYYVYVVANKKVGKTTYTSGKLYTYKVKGSKGSLRWTF